MKKIIILGGGAAGWITALFLKKIYKDYNISLIESKKIGILGAGEGSTPHLVHFLRFLEVDIKDLINKTKATIKNGINFENWNGDDKKYFHGFMCKNQFNNFKIGNLFQKDCYNQFLNNCISENLNLDDYTYAGLLTKNKKVDLDNQEISIHFDAHKIADYLKNLSITRGVNYYEGDACGFKQNHNGNINKIILEDKSQHECDFIFDCSGFRRLIIGKLFKTKWIDYQKYLPMKKAIPFFLDQEKEIEPCTHAIAMKYGWIWKIPLQHRFGSGYIFDSDFIDAEKALDEAEKKFNQKLYSPKIISFDAGRFEKVWVKNCIAVGLAAGFTEPLEATSLFITTQQLELLIHFKEYLFEANENKKNNYNEIMGNSNDDILDFLYLHYLTKRKDSDFWKNFKNNTKMPNGLIDKLENIRNNNFLDTNFTTKKIYASFNLISYLLVASGLGLTNSNEIKKINDLEPSIEQYQNFMLSSVDKTVSHTNLLNTLKLN